MPAGFDAAVATPRTPLPSCLSCGIKPPLAHILKAVIAGASGRQPSSLPANRNDAKSHLENGRKPGGNFEILSESALRPNEAHSLSDSKFQCPRCTFENHPSLLECELCGAPLVSRPRSLEGSSDDVDRSDSPGPLLEGIAGNSDNNREGIKLSFRDGGEKVFYERLKGAMTQRKWLLQNAPPIPRPTYSPVPVSSPPDSHSHDVRSERTKVVGIASLERRGQQLRKNNEVVIGSAFEDLAALMASAKEIVALAESFANKPVDKSLEANALLVESATALDMVITRDMLGSGARAQPLYLSELSRNLAEFLTDDAKGILRREGGIMSLVDLWAVFNRARGGVELISPADFEKAARLWETLCLPVRLRQFKNGLLVVQRYDWTDDKTIGQFLSWLQELHEAPSQENVPWDWQTFGCGVTAQATAHRFGWSVGVASEELEMAEERGVLCREDGVEGLRFWKNHILGQGN